MNETRLCKVNRNRIGSEYKCENRVIVLLLAERKEHGERTDYLYKRIEEQSRKPDRNRSLEYDDPGKYQDRRVPF